MKKAIKENFCFEEELRLFCYDPTTKDLGPKIQNKLGFSFYQEAFEYVKSRQRQELDFNANISVLRNRSQKACDMIDPFKKLNSGLEEIKSIKKEMKSGQERIHNDLMKMYKSIHLLCKNANIDLVDESLQN